MDIVKFSIISICNFIFFEYTYIVITNGLYGSSNCYLVGAIFFLYSNFHLRFVRESIFSLAVFLRKIEYFFWFGTIKVNSFSSIPNLSMYFPSLHCYYLQLICPFKLFLIWSKLVKTSLFEYLMILILYVFRIFSLTSS